MAIDTRWFRDRLADRQMSQRELARKMGLDHASISGLIRGKRPMRMQEAATIARLLGVPVSQVVEHAGLKLEDSRQCAIVGYVDGTGEAHIDWHSESDRAPCMLGCPERCVAIRFQTAATTLDHLDGWLAHLLIPDDGVPADSVGRLCLVKLREGMKIVATVRRGYQPGRWNLIRLAGGALEGADLQWATPIRVLRAPE
jgi:transcriptional regulator with XRE-family HTH domain